MITINLLGKDIELFYNTKALIDIGNRCGNISGLADWLRTDENTAERVAKYAGLLCDLANGGVYKHNCEITLGLKSGEKKDFYTDDMFLCLIHPNEFMQYHNLIFEALADGMKVDSATNEQNTNDPDLMDVESEKNLQGGTVQNVSA